MLFSPAKENSIRLTRSEIRALADRIAGSRATVRAGFVRFVDDDGTVLELQTAKTALQRSAISRAQIHAGVCVATP